MSSNDSTTFEIRNVLKLRFMKLYFEEAIIELLFDFISVVKDKFYCTDDKYKS